MVITRLCVFDFDGTSFRSPRRPKWWTERAWWTHPASLEPPVVPEDPGLDWWVASTVQAITEASRDPETYSVLLTGRDGGFEARVKQLVRYCGLHFDEIHLNPGEDTPVFKSGQVRRLLKANPEVKLVEIWEDRPGQTSMLEAAAEEAGSRVLVHMVKDHPHEPAGRPDRMVERVAHRFSNG